MDELLTVRTVGRKDRHTKVYTAKGLRDRRVRLSAPTAIQFFDVQDRLGFDQPSKAVEWLIKKAKRAIDELDPLPVQAGSHQRPQRTYSDTTVVVEASAASVSFTSVTPRFLDPGADTLPSRSDLGPVRNSGGGPDTRGQAGGEAGIEGDLIDGEREVGSLVSESRKGDDWGESYGGRAESRAKARERARERAKEKISSREATNSVGGSTTVHGSRLPLPPGSSIMAPSRQSSMQHEHNFQLNSVDPSHVDAPLETRLVPDCGRTLLQSSFMWPSLHDHHQHHHHILRPADSLFFLNQQQQQQQMMPQVAPLTSLLQRQEYLQRLHPLYAHADEITNLAASPSSRIRMAGCYNFPAGLSPSREEISNPVRTVSSTYASSTNNILRTSQAGPGPTLPPPFYLTTGGTLQSISDRMSSTSFQLPFNLPEYESGLHVMAPGKNIGTAVINSTSRIPARIQGFEGPSAESALPS